MTEKQYQIFLGTMLSPAIVKTSGNYRIHIPRNQYRYILYVKNTMRGLTYEEKNHQKIVKCEGRRCTVPYAEVIVYDVEELRKVFYKDEEKTLSKRWINDMSDVAFAHTFYTCGHYLGGQKGNMVFDFGDLPTIKKLKEWMENTWEIRAIIAKGGTGKKKYYYVYFPVDSFPRVRKIVANGVSGNFFNPAPYI